MCCQTLVVPAAKREIAVHLVQERQLSQRRACNLAGIPTCSLRYQSRRQDNVPVRGRLKELAQERPRFGYLIFPRLRGHRKCKVFLLLRFVDFVSFFKLNPRHHGAQYNNICLFTRT